MQESQLLNENIDRFTRIGFEIEPFGGEEYAVRAVPDNLFSIAKKDLLMEMIDDLADGLTTSMTPELIDEKVASMSCKAAVKGNNRLSAQEVDALIGELLTLDNPYHCPHGRPTIIAMTRRELGKKIQKDRIAMKKRPLIILTGPTAVGKTAASIGLAKAIGGEIISADSMQVYRHMDIGSPRLPRKKCRGSRIILWMCWEPEEPFSVVRFQEMAKEAVRTNLQQRKIPIVVGGTGFYIQALLYDIDFTENNDDMSYREQL